MKLNYYPVTDSLYIDLSERPSVESCEISDGVVLDYDIDGKLVGIDIETRADGIAKNAETNYQALFRYGGHQSVTRTWLKPTHQTETLISRKLFSHQLQKGFAADVHCVTGAPRESIVKFAKAEEGGVGGKGLWRPVLLGLRPTAESDAFKQYLHGGYVTLSKV